jgi:hypothetical protein
VVHARRFAVTRRRTDGAGSFFWNRAEVKAGGWGGGHAPDITSILHSHVPAPHRVRGVAFGGLTLSVWANDAFSRLPSLVGVKKRCPRRTRSGELGCFDA